MENGWPLFETISEVSALPLSGTHPPCCAGGYLAKTANELFLSFKLNATSLLPSIHAMVDKKALMEFPLRHVNNPSCCLSTIPAPTLNKIGIPSPTFEPTLNMESFDVNYGLRRGHSNSDFDLIQFSNVGGVDILLSSYDAYMQISRSIPFDNAINTPKHFL